MISRYNFSNPESSAIIDDNGLLSIIINNKIYGGIIQYKKVKDFIFSNSA